MDEETKTIHPAGHTEQPTSRTGNLVPAPVRVNLPATQPNSKPTPIRRRGLRVALAVVVVVGGAGAALYWWQHTRAQLPPGIASGNGRIEADEIDIVTKFAGRISEMLADEGGTGNRIPGRA
jgi:HlyD family secretion protein